jgi:hypothetical protein
VPSNNRVLQHRFAGGLATNLGSLAEVADFQTAGPIDIPFLLRAENVYFALNGGVRKIGGTDRYNATALESGDEVRGMFEFIKQGTAGSPTHKRIAVVSTKFKNDDNDGSFSDLKTGLTDNSVPNFCVFEDTVIISTDANETPQEWDQSSIAGLGGSPPNFAFAVPHANRVWASGDVANPSRVHYSGLLDNADWEGATNSGFIDVDPDDGDIVTGLWPFRGELIVFKGPNHGSIHRIQGLEPDDFARRVFARGTGAVWQNMIFELAGDLGFVDQTGNIRTLLSTDQFGDYQTNTLSREIQEMIERVTVSALRRGWAVTDVDRGYTLITLPVDSSSIPNLTLMMDTRFQRPRFATWPAIEAWSLARMSDPDDSNRRIVYAGGNDGYIRKLQQTNRAIDGTGSITAFVQTPFMNYQTPQYLKSMTRLGLGLTPKGSYTTTVGFRHETQGEVEIAQGGGEVLAPADDNAFTLDVSTLSEDRHRTRWANTFDGGQFVEVSYEISNSGLSEDMDVQTIYAVVDGSLEESYA